MKTFKITITGSGTKNMIEARLLTIVRELQFSTDDELINTSNISPFFEDEVLCTEIIEE